MNQEHVRLFVALELPGTVRKALAAWGRSAARPGLRAVPPESLHVTLCFLGSQPASEVEAIAAALEPAASRSAAALAVGEALWLPPRRPRVLAIELDNPSGALADTQATLARTLADGGWYEPEKRPFRPHVTVARVARGARIGTAELAPPRGLAFEAGTVTLFHSRLGAGGARYEPLARVPLGDPSR